MQQLQSIRRADLSINGCGPVDSDRHCQIDGAMGETMRLDTVDYRSIQSEQRTSQDDDNRQSLLTPARRAALDALEREFHDLLNTPPR